MKNDSVLAVHWGAHRTHDPAVLPATHDDLIRPYTEGAVDPLIDSVRAIGDLPAALRHVTGRASVGKVLVRT